MLNSLSRNLTRQKPKRDDTEDLRFAPASEEMSRKELLARADLLVKAAASGHEDQKDQQKPRRPIRQRRLRDKK